MPTYPTRSVVLVEDEKFKTLVLVKSFFVRNKFYSYIFEIILFEFILPTWQIFFLVHSWFISPRCWFLLVFVAK